MKYNTFNEINSEISINEDVTFSSDETVDTTLIKGRHIIHHKWANENFAFIPNDLTVRGETENLQEQLSVLDDFKIILFGCIGIRTYKIFSYV
ncbi:conserved Plasmodium protein, unknown function [Plasmodium malariae]|uniref:Uncharacterized protein n=1 Tax=Plasmodium malariae TaxID=5858 RepID=A0A1C3KDH8_PLAMA|nr:conserved Plasmodium protein, unknown function [Plasmodium malariae]SBT71660.1 conserved Plasmodium protein, unknown function [Plasmodium malariae]